jgi:MoxR-like ATPase
VGTQAPPEADTSLMHDIVDQVGRRIVGQDYLIERLLISILTGGHVLLEGVPGLAKTLAVSTLAETISTSFQRIQFTPDLLPADIVGTQIYDQSSSGEGSVGIARGDAGKTGDDRRSDVQA